MPRTRPAPEPAPRSHPKRRGAAERYAEEHGLTLPVFPFPLTPNAGSNQWRKKWRGKYYAFGPLDDPEGALRRYRREWPRITSGRPLTPIGPTDEPTLLQLSTAYLEAQRLRLHKGDIQPDTFRGMIWPLRELVGHLGPTTPVSALGPDDFTDLAAALLTSGRSPSYRTQLVGRIRQMFIWASEHLEIPQPAYGLHFTPPTRRQRQRHEESTRERIITPAEFWRLVEASSSIAGMKVHQTHRFTQHDGLILRAAMLLALNGGFTQTDLSETVDDDCDLDAGWIDQRRHKTGIFRAVPLWPETCVAIRLARLPGAARLLTLPSGKPLVRRHGHHATDYLARLFHAAREVAELDDSDEDASGRRRYVLTWRSFRKTFDTIAREVRDDEARRLIVAHGTHRMDRTYCLEFPRVRLRRVTDYVRAWALDAPRTPGSSVEDEVVAGNELVRALVSRIDDLSAELRSARSA